MARPRHSPTMPVPGLRLGRVHNKYICEQYILESYLMLLIIHLIYILMIFYFPNYSSSYILTNSNKFVPIYYVYELKLKLDLPDRTAMSLKENILELDINSITLKTRRVILLK